MTASATKPNIADLGAAFAADREDWDRALAYAMALKARFQFAKGIEVLRGFVDRPASSEAATGSIATLLFKMGRDQEAIETLRQGLDLNPDSHSLLMETRNALENRGRTAEALALQGAFVAGHPDDFAALNDHALLLNRTGRSDEAIALYTEYADRTPQDDGFWAAINCVTILTEKKRMDDAVATLKRRLVTAPDDWRPLANLSALLLAKGQGEEAFAAFRAYVAAHPGEWDPLNNLAMLLDQAGQPDAAIEVFLELLERSPGNPDALAQLSVLSRLRGRFSEFGHLWNDVVVAEHAMAPIPAEPGTPSIGVLDLDPARISSAEAARRLAGKGLVILRGALSPASVASLRAAVARQPVGALNTTCRLIEAMGSGEAVLAAVPDYVTGILRDIFGRDPLLSPTDCYGRQVVPANAQSLVPFHQDATAFNLVGVNVWVPLDPCSGERPGLELVAERLDRAWPTSAAYNYNEIDANGVLNAFRDRLVTPELQPGDCILFLSSTIHRTHLTAGMTEPRLSAEIRFN